MISFFRIAGATIQKDFRTAVSYGFATSVIAAFWGLIAFRFVSKLVNTGQFSGSSTAYFKYTVVGLLFASVLEPTAAGTAVSARTEQVQGTLEYLASQSVRRVYIGLSWSLFGLIQSIAVAVVVLFLTIPLGFGVSNVNFPVIISVMLLTIVIFSAIGNLGAALVILVQKGVPLVAGLFSIIGIISGTIFPVSEFPPVAAGRGASLPTDLCLGGPPFGPSLQSAVDVLRERHHHSHRLCRRPTASFRRRAGKILPNRPAARLTEYVLIFSRSCAIPKAEP
jgi:hypothetical protein